MTRSLRLSLMLFLLGVPAWGQVIGKAPAKFQFDGNVSEWDPSAALSFGDERTADSIGVAQVADGLIIAGMVRAGFVPLARTKQDLSEKGRIEMWLAE